jgi:hypothetical protein
MAATDIDKVFEQIEKDFVLLSQSAARGAATKAQKDIADKADKFITEYYASYKPKWYRRKKHLYKLVEKYYVETRTKKGIKIEFGIQYTPSKIRGLHKSYSPRHQSGGAWVSRMRDADSFHFDAGDNGIPEAEWITDKFLEGIHPSGKFGDEGGKQDRRSPDQKMQSFFNKELEDLVMTYMHRNLLDLVKVYF